MRQLGVFAKHWSAGQAKTRLARAIGPAPAANIARCMLEATLARFDTLGDFRVLAYTPEPAREEFHSLAGEAWILQPQCDGSLGRRMQHFFAQAMASGASEIVLIGSDSPTLPAPTIEKAFAQLVRCPVVLGPSDDGGYYLIGASAALLATPAGERVPSSRATTAAIQSLLPIFDEVAWGSDRVWRQTIERLTRFGIRYQELEAWYDVDERSDLCRLCRDCLAERGNPAIDRLLAAIRPYVPE